MTTPLPDGFGLAVDAATRTLPDAALVGGSPTRLLKLSSRGLAVLSELTSGAVSSAQAGALARRLTDAGLAHPRPPRPRSVPDVTVIVPVHDRSDLLDRCLTALGSDYRVVVVDDGSTSPLAVAEVCRRHGATVVRREECGGPAAARNTGLTATSGELVAFLDSDCVAAPGWIATLAAHLADPLVAVAAPRILPVAPATAAGRYAAAAGCLDLGAAEARVMPLSRVSYVPSTALVARRAALVDVASAGSVFDSALRYGEDVDLIWRLHERGWRIRYDPAARVRHHEPTTWRAMLQRRCRYGTSAAPLARRHPRATSPLVVRPWSALAVAGALTGSPAVAAAGLAGSVRTLALPMRRAGLPPRRCAAATAQTVGHTWLDLGRYATQFAGPAVIAAAVAPSRRPHPRRRLAAASLLLGPPLLAWLRRRPALDPVRFVAGHIADDISYGAGVYAGALREHSTAPLRPTIAWPSEHSGATRKGRG